MAVEDALKDPDTARTLLAMRAVGLGLTEEQIEALDEVWCNVLGIEDPDPLILPT